MAQQFESVPSEIDRLMAAAPDWNIHISVIDICKYIVAAIPFLLGVLVGTLWWFILYSITAFRVGFRRVV